MSCSDQRELSNRTQQLFLDGDTPRSGYQSSSPPLGSPKLKSQHTYMNPTASSMAKSSRSSSLGDGIHTGTPPGSPSGRRISSSELEVELTSPTVASASSFSSCAPSNSPCAATHHCGVSVTPVGFTQNVPPSRIPLPKQPLSSRRSLCLEVKPSSSWCGAWSGSATPTADPGCGASGSRQG